MNRRRQLQQLKKLSALEVGTYIPAIECIGKEFAYGQYLYCVVEHHSDKQTFTLEMVNGLNQRIEKPEDFVRHHCTPVSAPTSRPVAAGMARYAPYPDLKIATAVDNPAQTPAVESPRESIRRGAEKTSVLSFADGASYHLYASAYRGANHMWCLVIGVNGHFWTDDTRYAGRSVRYGSIVSEADALLYGLMLAEIYVQSQRQKREAEAPEGARQRLNAICYRLRRKPLRQLIHSLYPSQLHESVEIVVVAAEHLPLIKSEICAVMRGYDDVTIKLGVLS